MNIIRKHKLAFVMVVILAFIVSLIPVLGFGLFTTVGSEEVRVEFWEENEESGSSVVTDVVEREAFVYKPMEVEVSDAYHLDPPAFEENGTFRTTLSSSFSSSTTEQAILYEAYLEEGTTMRLDYRLPSEVEARFELVLMNADGIISSYEGSQVETITIEKSGNYALAYNANQFIGTYYVDLRLTEGK
ncbi:MAG TPA: hypothetical protein DCY20_02210 [Firmicutes bacterium]|nr:hypothetical protein [Bacillota bacterium]